MNRQIDTIFWDWDGTLCTERYFWPKSRGSDLEIMKLEKIWENPTESIDWMRGRVSLEELRTKYGCQLSYMDLVERLKEEWFGTSAINQALFSAIKGIYPEATHYILSDNMDIFTDFAHDNSFLRSNIRKVFNSAEYGKLKDDDPSLFSDVQRELCIDSFENCLLFDDSASSCDTFRRFGGKAVTIVRNQKREER